MTYFCQFCEKAFRRRFNRARDEIVLCPKPFDEEEGISSFSNEEEGLEGKTEKYDEDDVNEDNNEEDVGEGNADGNKGTDDDDKNTEGDIENNDVNPWYKLREEVIDDLNSAWEERVEKRLHQVLQKDNTQAQASDCLLPVYRKRLRHLYLGGTMTFNVTQ